jgi:hypothetical protein
MTASKTPPLHVLRRILRHIRTAPKQEMPQSTKTSPGIISSLEQSSTATGIEAPLSSSFKKSSWVMQRYPLAKHVISQYRAAKDVPPQQAKLLRKMAYDFHILKLDLRERETLHQLDGGAEVKLTPKEMSRLAARRAGLELPQETA